MRRTDREITEIERILEIVGAAKYLHLGLFDNEYPYVVPLHYGYEYTEGVLVFYLHSAKEGHKLDLIKENPNVCVELESDVVPVSGGEIACKYGSMYASVIGRGKAHLVRDEREKIRALELLMENQTGRRFTIDGNMASSVEVIKVELGEFTAKARLK